MRTSVSIALVLVLGLYGGCSCDDDDADEILALPDGASVESSGDSDDGDDEDEVLDETSGKDLVNEEREPNDDRGEATRIRTKDTIYGRIFNEDEDIADVDWYRFEIESADKPQVVDIEVSAVSGLDHSIELYKGPKKIGSVNKLDESSAERMPTEAVDSGAYFIRVAEVDPGDEPFRSDERYKLKIEVREVKEGEEVEPNNSVASAMPVEVGKEVTGKLATPGDVDYYKVGADGIAEGSMLSVNLSAIVGVKPSILMLDGIKDKVKGTSGAEGEKLSLKNIGVEPHHAPYYIAVKAASGSNPDQDYTLTIEAVKLEGEVEREPNDEPGRATLMEGGTRVAAFFSAGDKDYFKIEVPEAAIARVEVEGVPDVNFKIRLVDYMGKGLTKTVNEAGTGEGETITNAFIPKGESFIEIKGSGKNDDMPYSVGLGLLPDEGFLEIEPNNDWDKATPIYFDKPRKGYLHPRGDKDYFALDVGFGKEVDTFIKCTGVAKINHKVEVYNEGGEKIATFDDRGVFDPEEGSVKLNGSRFYLVVRATKATIANPRDEYTISVVKK